VIHDAVFVLNVLLFFNRRMSMSKIRDNIILFIAQGAYSGRAPVAPGTAGTAAGVLLYLALQDLGALRYGIACLAVIALGVGAAGRADQLFGTKDNRTIVIDEIAGYLVSMLLVPATWQYVTAAFFLFRAFDIFKPFPLRRLEGLPGGWGVMLDDIGAGVYTNIVLQIARSVLHQ
jgi:phosphatidylglycerophosphatase A